MSHFTVLVTKTNKIDLDEQLAPFDENMEMPRYIKHTKEQLIEKERKEIEEYKNTTYAKYLADPEKYERECKNPRHMIYIKEEFPKKLTWSDEEVYQDKLKYYEPEQIGQNGEVYSTYNQRSKWDWYSVGGRWTGYFKLKPGAIGELGEPGVGDNEPKYDADIAKVKDIDWQAMAEEQRNKAEGWWSEYETKTAAGETVSPYFDYGIEKDDTRETYIKRKSSVATFAVLHDGEWYEKGEMGWWAMVSNEKSPEEWQAKFDEIISSLDPEDEVTVVDAHI